MPFDLNIQGYNTEKHVQCAGKIRIQRGKFGRLNIQAIETNLRMMGK